MNSYTISNNANTIVSQLYCSSIFPVHLHNILTNSSPNGLRKKQKFTDTKANINQAESLGTLPMLIGWNGLLLVDTSATDRPVAKHPVSYLNTCKCHFFRIATKARKKIVMTPNCSQCAISRLKM